MVRALFKEDNAVWSLYLMIFMIFETVKQGLLRNPTIKFLGMAENATLKKEVQYSAFLINILFSIVTILVLMVFGTTIAGLLKSPDIVPLLWWSSILVLLLIPFSHCEVMLQAHYKFSSIFWANFIRQAIFFLGIIILYLFFRPYFNVINLLLIQIVALFFGSLVMFQNSRPYLAIGLYFNKSILFQMLHFGKYIFGTNLFSNLARSFDHFITANVLNPIDGKNFVANYNVVSRINTMLDVPSLAAADVLFPKNVETLETDGLGKVKYHFERMIATILALIIPASLFVFIFPKLIIFLLAGTKYYEAIPILQMTILFSISRPLGYLFGSTLDSIGKPRVNFYTSLLYMLISLGINYFCLYTFGGIGAAYASMINAVIGMIIMIGVLKKYIHLELRNIYRFMINMYGDTFKMLKKLRKTPPIEQP
ncbi:MAG: oligosaccharide flippase family protein [Chitinophagaceae bacterium]